MLEYKLNRHPRLALTSPSQPQPSTDVISPALEQLRKLQKSLYDKAHAEAHTIVAGSASRSILSYSAKFEKSLPQRFQRSSLHEMHEALRQSRIVLYGDFHTLRQSQRGLLRLMRSYAERQRTRKIVLALEMFKAIDQDHLDAYVGGALDEQEFLRSIDYDAEWGFPWQNFKMILDFARQRKLPVIGINTDNGGRDGLARRDSFAARRLVDAAERFPDHKIFCLIGEYHLADDHLPRCLSKELRRRDLDGRTLRVLNNVDRYYFRLQEASPTAPTEYLKLKKDLYCIMNSPPWMKWQSFSIWEELRSSGLPAIADQEGEIDQDFDLHTEDAFDVDYQFLTFVKNLAAFLEIPIDDSDIETFHIHYSADGDFFREITADLDIDGAEAERIIERATSDGVHFLPKSNTVLLTYMSINNLAEAAGQYLHSVLTGFNDTRKNPEDDFHRRVLKAAIGMIASKILNPRRKCMELHHWKQFLKRYKGRRLTGLAAQRRTTATAIIAYDAWFQDRVEKGVAGDAFGPLPRGILIKDRQANYEVSREVGQILGFNLYKKVLANKLPHTRLRRLYKKKLLSGEAIRGEVRTLHLLMLR